MTVWQVDVYRRPLRDESGNPLWELVVCNSDKTFAAYAFCPQADVNAPWIAQQLSDLAEQADKPKELQVFRPQAFSLIESAGAMLSIPVRSTRRTAALKDYLRDRLDVYKTLPNYTGDDYDPTAIDQPPPLPIDEALWGDRWRFGSLPAGDIDLFLTDKPIPIRDVPDALRPVNLGLASDVPVPGVVIDGGRVSMRLTRWLQSAQPVAINYVPGAPDGLILDAGLGDRWILATFDDSTMQQSARTYQRRFQATRGLHFLLVQPDDSGITYTGFWLLRPE